MFKHIDESKIQSIDATILRKIPKIIRRCHCCSEITVVDTTDGKDIYLCGACVKEVQVKVDFARRRIGPPTSKFCDVCHSNTPQRSPEALFDFGDEKVNLCRECNISLYDKLVK